MFFLKALISRSGIVDLALLIISVLLLLLLLLLLPFLSHWLPNVIKGNGILLADMVMASYWLIWQWHLKAMSANKEGLLLPKADIIHIHCFDMWENGDSSPFFPSSLFPLLSSLSNLMKKMLKHEDIQNTVDKSLNVIPLNNYQSPLDMLLKNLV